MIFTPPNNISKRDHRKKAVFLAGSIEMGVAELWQDDLGTFFENNCYEVFNPRRKDWDSTWIQSFDNPQFNQQVNWELTALDQSDLIFMYLDPKTKSPISLLELGLFAHSGKLKIVCPDGFYRKGNVEFVCFRHNIPMFNTIEEFKKSI